MNDPDPQLVHVVSYLQSELGYDSELPGNVPRHIKENYQMIRNIEDTLRGTGGELGVVGWISIFRRTWITLVALLGAAAGYMLNDVVDGIHAQTRPSVRVESRQ
ncbi:hypothetical protein [Adhaeretor mobilis]|uniref:Uncharacterized protein n=1 Tax=Adhaeretor mobilis TaxID=1930276 RepID=A0A517N2C7_9BACT|nr:hypothetical protein [Adhaeretor mobilis]QDT01282.1 hypothetical protein HG15A2_46240 [Adhaeretor mobilis]